MSRRGPADRGENDRRSRTERLIDSSAKDATAGSPAKSFDHPDRVVEGPGVIEEVVQFGPLTVARSTHAPGWRWSKDIQPIVGTERCQVRHVGVLVSGRLGLELADGVSLEVGPGTVYDIPPGHDGWTVGKEPAVAIEWTGVLELLMPAHGERVLASLLFTDIVGSTERARDLGDRRWRGLLAAHDDAIRHLVGVANGREVTTTGDGFLAVFEGPARAIQTALAIRDRVRALGLELRQGIHVGEVELVGADVRGIAVHEAARIMAAAASGEILVSSVTRSLTAASGYTFLSRGEHRLKGFPNPVELYAIETRHPTPSLRRCHLHPPRRRGRPH